MAPGGEHLPSPDEEFLGLDPEVEPPSAATHPARPTVAHALFVALGGALGTLARDVLVHVAPAPAGRFPWTLAVLNVAGAALLGVLVARILDPAPHRIELRLLLATGCLGGFTTYSSLVSSAVVLGHAGHVALAFATLLGTAVVGVAAAWLGARARPLPRAT